MFCVCVCFKQQQSQTTISLNQSIMESTMINWVTKFFFELLIQYLLLVFVGILVSSNQKVQSYLRSCSKKVYGGYKTLMTSKVSSTVLQHYQMGYSAIYAVVYDNMKNIMIKSLPIIAFSRFLFNCICWKWYPTIRPKRLPDAAIKLRPPYNKYRIQSNFPLSFFWNIVLVPTWYQIEKHGLHDTTSANDDNNNSDTDDKQSDKSCNIISARLCGYEDSLFLRIFPDGVNLDIREEDFSDSEWLNISLHQQYERNVVRVLEELKSFWMFTPDDLYFEFQRFDDNDGSMIETLIFLTSDKFVRKFEQNLILE